MTTRSITLTNLAGFEFNVCFGAVERIPGEAAVLSTIAATAILSTTLWGIPTSEEYLDGKATYMRPGRMEEVIAYRGLDLTGYVGAVALNRRADLRRRVWLDWGDGGILDGPYLVADCAKRGKDFLERRRLRRVVEVSAQVAKARGFFGVGPVPVRVWLDVKPLVSWPGNGPQE